MSYQLTAAIVNTETGEIRDYRSEFDGEPGGEYWQWTEGSFGCDCNRAIFFAEAGDPESCDGLDVPCNVRDADQVYTLDSLEVDGERVL